MTDDGKVFEVWIPLLFCNFYIQHCPVGLIIQLTCLRSVYTSKIIFNKMFSAYYVCSIGPFNMFFVECIFAAEMLMMDESVTVKCLPYISKTQFSLCL